jgi:hypothetical protein
MTSFGGCATMDLKLLSSHELDALVKNVNSEKQRREKESFDKMQQVGLSRFHAIWPQLENESGKIDVKSWSNVDRDFDTWFLFTPTINNRPDKWDDEWDPYKIRLAMRKDTGVITVHFDFNQSKRNFVIKPSDPQKIPLQSNIPMISDIINDARKVITKLSAL